MKKCPKCGFTGKPAVGQKLKRIDYRDEHIMVTDIYFVCIGCSRTFKCVETDYDVFEELFRTYRAKRGYIQPNELKSWRKRLHLSTEELDEHLNFTPGTIKRLEDGSMQTKWQDDAIRKAIRLGLII